MQTKATYDEYGRVLTSTNADGDTTTTAYTPSTGAEPTTVAVTEPASTSDPKGLTTTTTDDPGRDLPLTVTNPAGWETVKAYDALGGLTSAWTPGNASSGAAQDTFSYAVSNTAPSVAVTETEEPGGTYLKSETLYDSLGRERETQQETADGNRDVSDIIYDSSRPSVRGLHRVLHDRRPVFDAGHRARRRGALADRLRLRRRRPGDQGHLLRAGHETWETDTTYGGNYTTVVPPSGGTTQTTFTNGEDETTAIWQWHDRGHPQPDGHHRLRRHDLHLFPVGKVRRGSPTPGAIPGPTPMT